MCCTSDEMDQMKNQSFAKKLVENLDILYYKFYNLLTKHIDNWAILVFLIRGIWVVATFSSEGNYLLLDRLVRQSMYELD